MTTTVNTQKPSGEAGKQPSEPYSVERLAAIAKQLSFKDKVKLADLIEEQIFEEEEDHCEMKEEALAELEAARAEIARGEYDTYDDYIAEVSNRSSGS